MMRQSKLFEGLSNDDLTSGVWNNYNPAMREPLYARAEHRCEFPWCGIANPPGGFEVHHLDYSRKRHERLTDLILLCADCHRSMHRLWVHEIWEYRLSFHHGRRVFIPGRSGRTDWSRSIRCAIRSTAD